jgi:O-methyltransferase involved in polyketide biosynthesis
MNGRADGNDVQPGRTRGDGGAGPADASRPREEEGAWPRSFDASVPNVARMYDYMLGGKDNFQVDRDAVAKVLEALPEGIAVVRQNRAFLRRVVRFLAGEAKIRQFLDLGSGLPTMQNVHEVAQEVNPEARVAYADHDPVVLAHARALLEVNPNVRAVNADLRYPRRLLDSPDLREFLDPSRPVAVLLVSVLHFLPAEEVKRVVGEVLEAVPAGSYLVVSHGTSDNITDDSAAGLSEAYAGSAAGGTTPRPRGQILEFFEGWDLVEPGLAGIEFWRPEQPVSADRPVYYYGGVARKP